MSHWNSLHDYDEHFIPFGGSGYLGGSALKMLSVGDTQSIRAAYDMFSPVAAVIIRLAEMLTAGKFEVLESATGNYTAGKYREWEQFLEQPNYFQTRDEFLKQMYTYTILNGYCYALPKYPAGFTDRPSDIFLIPPEFVHVEPIKRPPWASRTREPEREVIVSVPVGGSTFSHRYKEKDLILFKDTAAAHINPMTWLPESRLKSLKYPISNGYAAMESRNSLIVDRGANGILTNDTYDHVGSIPLNPDEQKKLEDAYRRRYGLTKDKDTSIIISRFALKWQSMTFDSRELQLHEEHVDCVKDICDVLGYQYRLLSTGEGATYQNQESDLRSVYQNTIIPQAEAFMRQLNNGLNSSEIEVHLNYKDIECLQKSQETKGKGRLAMNRALRLEWLSGLITRNQWLEALEIDTVDRPDFDKYIFELTPEQRGVIDMGDDTDSKDQSATAT